MAEKKNFVLRLDADTYRALEAWAADELRSVNGQVEYVLRQALRGAGRLPKAKGAAPSPDQPVADSPPAED